ncbi:MAG: hypothetical protein HKN26_16705 [Acidimicrobiales bacterium]|nr:hypothetical protein [Acidimicrobiales bacterium]
MGLILIVAPEDAGGDGGEAWTTPEGGEQPERQAIDWLVEHGPSNAAEEQQEAEPGDHGGLGQKQRERLGSRRISAVFSGFL